MQPFPRLMRANDKPTGRYETAMTRQKGFSRRQVLKTTASIAAGAATMSLTPGVAQAQTPELNMWWWGEQELPGLQGYVDDSVEELYGRDRQADAAGHGRGHLAVPDRRRRGQGAGHPVSLERHLPHGERLARLSAPARRLDQRRHDQGVEPDTCSAVSAARPTASAGIPCR